MVRGDRSKLDPLNPHSAILRNEIIRGSAIYWLISSCRLTYHDCDAVVTPLRKAAAYEPRMAILGIWGDTWLTRGKYGIYVAVRGSYGVYVTPSAT